MSGILVLAEQEGGTFKRTAFELLGKAGELAGELGCGVAAAVLGDAPAGELGAFGAAKVYQVAGDFSVYSTNAIVAALEAIVAAAEPDLILCPSSYTGKDAIPRLTARLNSGQASECTDLRVDGGVVVGRRPIYAGKAFVDVKITRGPGIFSLRPNSFGQPTPGGGAADVVAVAVDLPAAMVTVAETKTPDNDDVDLTEADRIVGGGRGLKGKEQFDEIIRGLANTLGATVGASRAAVDAGFASHNDQVGQTGKTVNPQLYIAVGVSGAIQHLAGMRTSKVIVAINKDAEAPIFEHATYGLVGDLFEVCPKLLSELEALN